MNALSLLTGMNFLTLNPLKPDGPKENKLPGTILASAMPSYRTQSGNLFSQEAAERKTEKKRNGTEVRQK